VNTVLRFLGIQLVARLAAGLPGGVARLVTAAILVATNLLPIWAVATERAGMGDRRPARRSVMGWRPG